MHHKSHVCWISPLPSEIASTNLHQIPCYETLGTVEGTRGLQQSLSRKASVPLRISQWLMLEQRIPLPLPGMCVPFSPLHTVSPHPMHHGRLEGVGQTPCGIWCVFSPVTSSGCQPDIKFLLCCPPTRPATVYHCENQQRSSCSLQKQETSSLIFPIPVDTGSNAGLAMADVFTAGI